MQLFTNLTKDNVALYAAVHYENPHFTKEEHFNRDLRKVSIIKKHMNKFDSLDDSQEDYQELVRKITNNIIIFLNLFGTESGVRILFTLMEDRFLSKLRPILELIMGNDLPLTVEGVNNLNMIVEQIETDEFFASFVNNMKEYQGIKENGRKR